MQGRFKRDGSAAADPELRGGTDRASSPQRAQSSGSAGGTLPVDGGGQAPGNDAADSGKAKAPKGAGGPGSRIALRNWRISTRLVSLLALPVVAATTLGGMRIGTSMENIDQLDKMQLLTEMTRQATELADALQVERDKSAGPLAGSGNSKDDANVVAPREATDRAKLSFNQATGDIQGQDATMAGVRATVLEIGRQLNTLNEIRANAYKDDDNSARTVTSYNQLINSLLSLSQDMAQATSNPEMIRSTRALAAFSSAKEYASIQRALVSAGLAHKGGPQLSSNDRLAGRNAEDSEKAARDRFSQIYTNNAGALTRGLDGNNDEIKAAVAFAHRAFASGSGIRSQDYRYLDWYDSDTVKIDEMSRIETTLLSEMEQKSRKLRSEATQSAIISGALILLVLGVSLVGAFVVARSMVRSLRRLQDTAQKVAQDRLPELVKQLSESDPQDVDTSVQSVGVHSRDEIGRVAAAFDDVHREAVRLASEQALLRGNVNAMFTNLSRRSQGLIQRQLSLISELESREADPDQLSSLFKLDHLATRMRRNGENLLVLAGEEPGRRWTRPVPLVDVLRAAASEVEQYERIELNAVPQTEVAGRVVNDLVHLLAELLENATSFSSPQTKVKVTGHALPDGRVLVEIHDTGIGLSPEDLSAINERLASPPTVDVSVSRRMGLFVVGRLSLRHGIRIQLRPSDSGGTTALVMLPVDLAQGGKKPAPSNAKAGGDHGGGQSSRLAGLQPRGQVGSGPTAGGRPALPGRGGPGGGPGGGAPNAFGAPAPAGRTAPPGAGSPGAPARGGDARPVAGRPGDSRPSLPTRGADNGPAPTVAPPTGAPRREERPQLPARNPAAELPGGSPAGGQGGQGTAQPGGTSWGARRERGGSDDWPLTPREAQDRPRGHEEPESTGSFERPAPSGGPGDTAAFARPDFNGPPPAADGSQGGRGRPGARPAGRGAGNEPEGTGQFAVPETGTGRPDTGQRETGRYETEQYDAGRYDTGQYETGQFPQSGSDTGQYEQPGSSTGQYEQPGSSTGQYQRPGSSTGQYEQPGSSTGQYRRPDADRGGYADESQGTGQFPAPQPQEGGAPSADVLGNADAGPGDGRTPIFDTIESNWFNTPAATAAGVPPQGDAEPEASRLPRRGSAQDGEVRGGARGEAPVNGARNAAPAEASQWRSSPNDETWRQAEQIRQPAAGGITTSGLPRRVPRANLVAGTAQQQPTQSGPQVSRAPGDVRGRLTNLRRGIQQGRQAGTSSTGNHGIVDPTHQQER
ncbi:Signal transduction histidine kinase [Streptomyces sp. 2112.3]|uniref:sensor histidine kinase n=1 Tax=Streptomyces sp. 2112.3 TaxID=1881023 RepID=UPI00089BAA41|nr:nitrate- and nitrite sensing domain-containing protein [Streptomyces sp. 2112.3]SEE21518.1 Signal transduction histidine kinase [Streptomyces sp. 2112.3]